VSEPPLSADEANRQQQAFCSQIKSDALSLPRDDGAYTEAVGRALGCYGNRHAAWTARGSSGVGVFGEVDWLLDRGMKSELLRAYKVLRCMPTKNGNNGPSWDLDPKNPAALGAFATCSVDARKLDASALEEELKAPRFNAWARIGARETFTHAKNLADKMVAAIRSGASDDAKQLVFDLPDKAFADWDALYTANKAAIDQAFDFDATFFKETASYKGGTTPFATKKVGCAQTVRKSFEGYVTSKSVKSIDDLKKVGVDPVGFVLLDAAIECDVLEGRYVDAEWWLSKVRFERGPRYLAYWAIQEAQKPEAWPKFPNPIPSLPTSFPPVDGPRFILDNSLFDRWSEDNREAQSVIASLTPQDRGTQVTFVPVTTMVPDRKCDYGRILRWDSSGTPQYETSCVITGYHPETTTLDPVVLSPESAQGLKPGMLLRVYRMDEAATKTPLATPLEVWTNANATKLASIRDIPIQ
jgi:hypothetical protein